jgi:hypothetical protein
MITGTGQASRAKSHAHERPHLLWFNARMPASPEPAVELVVGLDRPTAGQIVYLFKSLDTLWEQALGTVESNVESSHLPPAGLRLPRTPIRIQRLRLESPLEVALTAATSTYAPIGYVMAGLAVLERTVRLVMDWQKHRAELTGLQDHLDVTTRATEGGAAPPATLEEVVSLQSHFHDIGLGLPARIIVEATRYPIISVRRVGDWSADRQTDSQ